MDDKIRYTCRPETLDELEYGFPCSASRGPSVTEEDCLTSSRPLKFQEM